MTMTQADLAAYRAAQALASGALAILPTETVYGLAADAGDPRAVAALFQAKGRPRFNPLIAHVADLAMGRTVGVFDDRAVALAQAFWPGPLTLVLPVADVDRVTVRYAHPLKLMADLRQMGETNALADRHPRALTRQVLVRTFELYQERFGEADGRIPATFEILTLTGWAPHASQQQPLKPGSAKMRLAEALGVEENPLPREED